MYVLAMPELYCLPHLCCLSHWVCFNPHHTVFFSLSFMLFVISEFVVRIFKHVLFVFFICVVPHIRVSLFSTHHISLICVVRSVFVFNSWYFFSMEFSDIFKFIFHIPCFLTLVCLCQVYIPASHIFPICVVCHVLTLHSPHVLTFVLRDLLHVLTFVLRDLLHVLTFALSDISMCRISLKF
jgi:hypothetical protein